MGVVAQYFPETSQTESKFAAEIGAPLLDNKLPW
jgi:hypothetical protein